MNSYMFRQWCRPRDDFRIDDMIDFFDLMKEAFQFPILYDGNSKPVRLTREVLLKICERRVNKPFPSIGATEVFFSIPPRNRDRKTVRFEIHTGTGAEKLIIDTYNIAIGDAAKAPNFDYLERSIEIFRPFEAFIEESENEYILRSFERQRLVHFEKPAIIRGFHYLDETMARSIGGIKRCLKAPAWHVEKFCDGVLIELVPGLFDSDNPEHLEVQRDVMDYFDML